MGTLNRIVFPLAPNFKDPFVTPENGGLFDGDSLSLCIDMEDYNAPNPKSKEVKEGVTSAVADIRVDYYKPEFVSRDSRSRIRDILEAIEAAGNLDAIGLANPDAGSLDLPPVVLYDYHRLDTASDRAQGYTVRIGIFEEIEDLKGTFRSGSDATENLGKGTRARFVHIFNNVGGTLVDARFGQ